jgi:type VI secretion system secreted protein VgrG
MIQVWQALDESEQHLAQSSATHPYGQQRSIAQRFLEGTDNWQISGKSWHWQPVTASTVYESKGTQP